MSLLISVSDEEEEEDDDDEDADEDDEEYDDEGEPDVKNGVQRKLDLPLSYVHLAMAI